VHFARELLHRPCVCNEFVDRFNCTEMRTMHSPFAREAHSSAPI
jgi:hypothetical protein